jgi:hypothetical protein
LQEQPVGEGGNNNEEKDSKSKSHWMGDALFGCIERNQGQKSFGTLLDAGTGSHSLRWIASLLERGQLDQYTAVTADATMQRTVQTEAKSLGIEDQGSIIIGNWATTPESSNSVDHEKDIEIETSNAAAANKSPYPCRDGELYDVILADYLVGAMDGFSPYFQDQIFPLLAKHLKPGGRLYVVGLNPIPDSVVGPSNVFCEITKVRDACILLAEHRCYREYPPSWIERHLVLAGLQKVERSQFPILYSFPTMQRQINVARSKLPFFPSKGLANEMAQVLNNLERKTKEATDLSPNGRLKLGFDYVITAENPIVPNIMIER